MRSSIREPSNISQSLKMNSFDARSELGVGGGMVLDVGTRVGLIALKILWQNENFYSIGLDSSSMMIERARETATAWGLGERAFFQVGDARRMRFKTAYFDLVISDSTLHCFDDPISVLSEIHRVLKPKGAFLIRDFERPSRFKMATQIEERGASYGEPPEASRRNGPSRRLHANRRSRNFPAGFSLRTRARGANG